MKFDLTYSQNLVVISIEEKNVIRTNAELLINKVKESIDQGNVNFIVDLKNVVHLNSSGINLFISILTLIRNAEGELVLTSISEKIKNLLIITKLNSIFKVSKSIDEATIFLNAENKVDSNQ